MIQPPAGRALVDVSHAIESGMVTLKGFPAPVVCDYLTREQSRARYSAGTEFHIGRIDMIANTGTYVDAPFHRFPDGTDIAELPLESLADLDGTVVDAPLARGRAIGRDAFAGRDVRGRAVLVRTGWDRRWGTDAYFEGHPFLTRDAARHLAASGAALVGIDSLNVDDTDDGERPAHTILLGAGIPIAEHLRGLDRLPEAGFRFFAVPARVRAMGTFPVRAFAVVGGPTPGTSPAGSIDSPNE
jgi:kynurenine formamidase